MIRQLFWRHLRHMRDLKKTIAAVLIPLCVATVMMSAGATQYDEQAIDLHVWVDHWINNGLESLGLAALASEPQVIVLAIDELTYATPPFAGTPRVLWTPHLAQVIDKLLTAKVSMIGLDLVLPTSASAFLTDTQYDRPLMTVLRKAALQDKIALGEVQLGNTRIQPQPALRWAAGPKNNVHLLNLHSDSDGVIRRYDTRFKDVAGQSLLSFAARMAGVSSAMLATSATESAPRRLVAVDTPIPYVSFAELWQCEDPQKMTQLLANKRVIIGTVLELEDRVLSSQRLVPASFQRLDLQCSNQLGQPHQENHTARASTTPGVFVQAQAATNILQGQNIDALGSLVRWMVVFVTGLLLILLPLYLAPAVALSWGLSWLAGWMLVSQLSFTLDLLLPTYTVLLSGLVPFLAVFLWRFLRADRVQKQIQAEMNLAAQVQKALLPQDRKDLPITCVNHAAKVVSGDFYDYIMRDDGRLVFCLGDVSGKGMNAAILMTKTVSLFRLMAKQMNSPGTLLAKINEEVCETVSRGMFVTLICGIYEPATGRLIFSNAGHEPPLLITDDDQVTLFPAQTRPVGILSNPNEVKFPEQGLVLSGRFFIYTDGLTEGRLQDGTEMTADGVLKKFKLSKHLTLRQQVNDAVEPLLQSGLPLRDDLTLLILSSQTTANNETS